MSVSWKGDLAEQLFVLLALENGLTISRPFQSSSRYDFIVDNSRFLYRVQVKAVFTPKKNNSHYVGFATRYKPGDFDFLAVYVREENRFFILPFREIFSGRIKIIPEQLRSNGINILL